MKLTKIMSFEQFAAQNGGVANWGDPGLHSPAAHMPVSTWKRMVETQAAKDAARIEKRRELRKEFQALVAAGYISEPTVVERMRDAAQGEGLRAEAARRILAKREARKL